MKKIISLLGLTAAALAIASTQASAAPLPADWGSSAGLLGNFNAALGTVGAQGLLGTPGQLGPIESIPLVGGLLGGGLR
ncbi:hypothetical protein [Streptomyces vinaceus]|uniref:hypothetical protein n=1 Tax=Streptomyces vinaceus TaxID=1960 RepID=UPI0038113254